MSTAGLLVIALDRDTAGHLAVALRRHRGQLEQLGLAEPPGLADLETLAQTVTKSHEPSPGFTVGSVLDTDSNDRDSFTRQDVSRRTGTSLSTVDRWIRTGVLPSVKHGRTRRVTRADLDRFLTPYQRDLSWLRHATPEQIDRALERGELDRVLGRTT